MLLLLSSCALSYPNVQWEQTEQVQKHSYPVVTFVVVVVVDDVVVVAAAVIVCTVLSICAFATNRY